MTSQDGIPVQGFLHLSLSHRGGDSFVFDAVDMLSPGYESFGKR